MKLHPAEIPLRDHGWVSHAVVGLAHNHFPFRRLAKIGMNEIEKLSVDYPFKQRMSDSLPDLIPANLRHNQLACKTPNAPRQKTQARLAAKLIRLLKKHLHADADAE